MRSMKWIAVLSATTAALSYAGIPVEYKRIAIAGLGITTTLLALYNVLRYGPLVQGIERRAATRAAAKAAAPRAHRAAVEASVVSPIVVEEVADDETESHQRIAISRSTTARPPRVRRATTTRRVESEDAHPLVTMLPVEDKVASTDNSSHA